MATENTINGNYAAQKPYEHSDQYNAAASGAGASEIPSRDATSAARAGNNPGESEDKPPTKEEIGWYFVEQYYKTLCNEPAKLYLYYNKRSQLVSGDEAEKVQVAVGQKAIAERIKQLDIQDCKVRVLNVDSQESLKNILVQVIGEMSNKAEPHRKFVQTFVLAEQPSGYYVLNDVFRYIILDEEEFENGLMAPESVEAPAAAGSTEVDSVRETVVASQQPDLEQVDEKLEEDASAGAQGTDDEHVNGLVVTDATGVSAEGVTSASSVAPQGSPDTTVDPSKVEAVEPTAQPEEPKDPAPSPVPAVAKSQSAPEPPKPAAPKTWANLVAANRTTAVLQVTAPTQAPAGSSNIIPKTKPQTSSKEAVTPPAPVSEEVAAKGQPNGNAEWQTAGSSNDKRQNRQHSQSVSGNQETVLGYVKNVTDKVDASILKEKLNQLGKLTYFDVSRQKNCAFVEFADVAAYNAVIAANPLNIGGEQVIVEERRPRANAYGGNFANRGGVRGGRGGGENRPPNQGRGGFNKDGGRGGYGNRTGRGGPIAARGRGQPQAA